MNAKDKYYNIGLVLMLAGLVLQIIALINVGLEIMTVSGVIMPEA